MNTKDNLNTASMLGNTIAGLLVISTNNSAAVQTAVGDLIVAMAAKARGLLNGDQLELSIPDGRPGRAYDAAAAQCPEAKEQQVAAGAECAKCGQVDAGQTGEYPCADCGLPKTHDSDCSTNNRGVPELLGKCDCSIAPCEHNAPASDCPCASESTRNLGRPHNLNCNFEHFLAYTGLMNESPEIIAKVKLGYADQWRACVQLTELESALNQTAPIATMRTAVTEHLRRGFADGHIDHVVRVVSDSAGSTEFYIRPLKGSGETTQFVVLND
jgi:hypothetical protein